MSQLDLDLKMAPKGASKLSELISLYKDLPKSSELIPGIVNNSFGFIYGQPKVGKSIFGENLGFSISAGRTSFLNYELNATSKKCLYISLEERLDKRIERNQEQLLMFSPEEQQSILENYVSSDLNLPDELLNDSDWKQLFDLIAYHEPAYVCIDSISRLTAKALADEEVCKQLSRRLRNLVKTFNITLLVINHTPKKSNEFRMEIFGMSGSRILSQKADFQIAISKAENNTRYIKRISNRYRDEDNEFVDCFKINDKCFFDFEGQQTEAKILKAGDRRVNPTSRNIIYQTMLDIVSASSDPSKKVDIKDLKCLFEGENAPMSKSGFYENIGKMVKEKMITCRQSGIYEIT